VRNEEEENAGTTHLERCRIPQSSGMPMAFHDGRPAAATIPTQEQQKCISVRKLQV
jgi:hypothetical protein